MLEAHICLKFLEEYGKTRHRSISYRGESLATFCQMIFDDLNRACDRPFITKEIRQELTGRQKGRCAQCGDETLQEVDHKICRGANCYGSDAISNLNFLCSDCHKDKTQQDHTRMNVEDPNVFMSRFNMETWEGFVMSRKPTQVVCNLHEESLSGPGQEDLLSTHRYWGGPCLEIDVKSCRLNGIIEGNAHEIPIFSPLDEFTKPIEGTISDYSWVDIGNVRALLANYIYDGPRWYDRSTVQFMLETGVCKWSHVKLAFNATTHKSAAELAWKLKRIQKMWFEVGGSCQGVTWAGCKAKKKDTKELLAKTALLSLLGSWGRTKNFRHQMITTSHPDDTPFSGETSEKPTPHSETTPTGYVFHDISWKQKILNLGTFLPLNLIGRSQERLQVARALKMLEQCSKLRKILSIQIDGIYLQPPKTDFEKIQKQFQSIRYCDLHKCTSPLIASMSVPTLVKQEASKSTELVYKANECEPKFPGGTLKIAEHLDPPYHDELAWTTYSEPKRGPDEFLERVLQQVNMGKSFTILGAPGVGKTWILAKVK